MKLMELYIILFAFVLLLIAVAFGIINHGNNNYNLYSVFYEDGRKNGASDSDWHMVIYIDIEACLSCTEDMAAWNELEDSMIAKNYDISIWAPKEDSFDVAYAMELEGLITPVRVLDRVSIYRLGWNGKLTPIKLLLDREHNPVYTFYANRDKEQSRRVIDKIMATL